LRFFSLLGGDNKVSESRIAVVSGATGFLGTRVVKHLQLEGWQVRAVTSGVATRGGVPRQFDVECFSLSDKDIEAAVSGASAYFNCSVIYDRPETTDEEIQEVNVELPIRVVRHMLAVGQDFRCVLADSFNRKFPIGSTTQPRYTASKLRLAERVARLSAEQKVKIVLLLIEHMYGPNDSPKKVLPFIADSLSKNVPRIALTSGRQRRDFVHVDDVASAMLIAQHGAQSGLVEAGCGIGTSVSLREAICLLRDLCGSSSELGFGDLPNTPNEILDSKADISWLSSRGWKPAFGLERGFRDLLTRGSSADFDAQSEVNRDDRRF
jgi:CDP-paratose synthetase